MNKVLRAMVRVRRGLRRFARERSGQTLVLAAVAMVVVLGFVGLAVDVGNLRFQRRNLQMAADAAATAAALELQTCGGTAACTAMQTAAKDALTENGMTTTSVTTNCAASSASGLRLMVNNGPCMLGANDPNNGKGSFVEVVLQRTQPTYFAKVLGFDNVPLAARAEAARSGGTACMWALDPSGSNALTVDMLAAVSSSCGIVVESTASNALSCNLFASIKASSIAVAGGVENFLCSIAPTPVTKAANPTPLDPLASLLKPTVPACGTSTSSPYHGAASALTISGTAVLYADKAYCGGITIQPGAHVTFQPGVYVLTSSNNGVTKSPGGLTVDLGTSVSGSGVTFYNYGPAGAITFNYSGFTAAGVNLVAPASGTYAGVLFLQDPGDTAAANIIGSSSWNTVLEGTYYFPRAKVTYAFSGAVNYNILVAYDIEFAALTYGTTSLASGFASDYSSLATGSPVSGTGAVLVQ